MIKPSNNLDQQNRLLEESRRYEWNASFGPDLADSEPMSYEEALGRGLIEGPNYRDFPGEGYKDCYPEDME